MGSLDGGQSDMLSFDLARRAPRFVLSSSRLGDKASHRRTEHQIRCFCTELRKLVVAIAQNPIRPNERKNLRTRADEIPDLVMAFIAEFNAKAHQDCEGRAARRDGPACGLR